MFHQSIRLELSLVSPTSQITTCNKSLHDSANTTSQISDRRQRAEMSAIREMKERRINKERQIADCLTKKGASCISMLTTLKNEKLH